MQFQYRNSVEGHSTALTRIDEYQVMYSANKFPPRIWLKKGGKYVGQLIFKPSGSELPSDNKSGAQVNLYYHLEDFNKVVDLLRNEKPMYLLYSGSGPGFENGIRTTAETVGEEEEGLSLVIQHPLGQEEDE